MKTKGHLLDGDCGVPGCENVVPGGFTEVTVHTPVHERRDGKTYLTGYIDKRVRLCLIHTDTPIIISSITNTRRKNAH